METFDYSSDSDSVYYSCQEGDDDLDGPDAPDAPGAPCFLGSTSGEPFYKDWYDPRMMVCISAARILLAETLREGREAGSVKPFQGEVVLKWILAACAGWRASFTDHEFTSFVTSPVFQSSLDLSASETQPCSLKYITRLVGQLQDSPAAIVLSGHNDAVTVIRAPSSFRSTKRAAYIVFNPRCRASVEMKGLSLRYLPTLDEAVNHIYNILAIHRGAESTAPEHMCASYTLIPSTAFAQSRTVVVYQADLCVMEGKPAVMKRLTETPLMKKKKLETHAHKPQDNSLKNPTEPQNVISKGDLEEAEALAAALHESSQPSTSGSSEAIPAENLPVSQEGTSSSSGTPDRISNDTDATGSHQSNPSTAPTTPDMSWSCAIDVSGTQVLQQQAKMSDHDEAHQPDEPIDEEANLQAAWMLQAQLNAELEAEAEADDEASFALALKLSMDDVEEPQAVVTQPSPPIPVVPMQPTCPLCLDGYEVDQLLRISGCGHAVCRICLRQYVGGRIRTAGLQGRGIIECPVCQPNEPNRGVVLQSIADLIG